MRKEKKDEMLCGQIKKAITESETFQEPIKSFFGHAFNKWLLAIFGLVTGLYLFPFAVRSIIAESVVLIVIILVSTKLVKTRKGSTRLRFWIVIIAILWFAAVCPFLVFPKPIYISVLDSKNPIRAKIQTLESGGKIVGTELLLTDLDFMRVNIASALCAVFPEQFRPIEKIQLNNTAYYKLPIFKGFIIDSGNPGDYPLSKTIYFPVDSADFRIELDLTRPQTISGELHPHRNDFFIGSGITSFPFLDSAYKLYPETTPWEAVEVQKGQEERVLKYAALLDRSLQFFATGRPEDGLNGLEAASTIVPAPNLEGARLAVLELSFVQLSLRGDVGDLQALPFLHRAYDIFMQSKSDPRFSEKDPLTNWLRQRLSSSYEDWIWSAQFLDKINSLNQVPHVADEGEPYTKTLERNFAGKSYGDLMCCLKTNTYSSVELHFIRSFAFTKFGDSWLVETSSDATNGNMKNLNYRTISENAKAASPVIHFLDAALAKKAALQTSPEVSGFIDFCAYDFPQIMEETNNNKVIQKLQIAVKGNPMLESFFDKFLNHSNELATAFQAPISSKWWRTDYLNWFSFWSLSAAMEINKHDCPDKVYDENDLRFISELNVRKMITQNGEDYLTKDLHGNGQTFLPGLFVLAWYSQTFGLDGADNLKQQFEIQSKLPFTTYLSKLFAVEGESNGIQTH